jgi:hypothetical protein
MGLTIDFAKREDVEKMFQLDKAAFGIDECIEPEVLIKWFDANNYQWIVARDEEDNVLGCIGLCHLKKEVFEKLTRGEITEKDLNEESFMSFKEGKKIYCYLSSFVVKDNNSSIAVQLLCKSLSYFRFLKKKNVKVEKMCAMAVTKQGEKLCEKLGFKIERKLEKQSDGVIPKIYVYDFNDENYSKLMNQVKDIFLDSEEYL